MSRSKHCAIEKLHLLEAFRDSGQSIGAFARQYEIDHHSLRRWQTRYALEGLKGLEEFRANQHYSKELKLSAVLTYRNDEGSLFEVAMQFGLRSAAQLANWVTMYNEDNKSLTDSPSRKQVPTMSCKTTFEERLEVEGQALVY